MNTIENFLFQFTKRSVEASTRSHTYKNGDIETTYKCDCCGRLLYRERVTPEGTMVRRTVDKRRMRDGKDVCKWHKDRD